MDLIRLLICENIFIIFVRNSTLFQFVGVNTNNNLGINMVITFSNDSSLVTDNRKSTSSSCLPFIVRQYSLIVYD